MNMIETQWESYKKHCLYNVTNPIQLMETKRGFFAGAKAFSKLIDAIAKSDVSDDDGGLLMQQIHMEITKFAADVKNGSQ